MLNKLLLATTLVVTSGTASFAQNFTGAELGIEFRDVIDEGDLGSVTYSGAVEFEAYYGISVALDGTAYAFDIGPSGIANVTAHVSYALNPAMSAGIFLGQDFSDENNGGTLGAEIIYDYGLGDVEAYFGSAEDAFSRDLTIFGAEATYDIARGFAFAASLDALNGDDISAAAFEIGGFYTLPNGPTFGVTIGQIDQDDGVESSETFFGLHASIATGPNGGTTFGRRGAYEAVKAGSLATP